MSYALIRASWDLELDLGAFARATGTHPDLARRLVALGIIDARQDASGELWFAPSQLATFARVQRLRAGFALNYAAVGLVIDLLDRIADLEAALRRAGPAGNPRDQHGSASPGGRPPGTPRDAGPAGNPRDQHAGNPRERPGNYPGG